MRCPEDGTLWEYRHNDQSQVTSAVKGLAGLGLVPGQSFGYHYDGMGNRITSSAGTLPDVATTVYTADALNQYATIETPGKADILVRSDQPVGISVDGSAVTPSVAGNLRNAHATVTNEPDGAYYEIAVNDGTTTQTGRRWLAPSIVTPEYDADGNLTKDGRWSYTWDTENRLVRMETLATAITAGSPDQTLEYTYDFMGRRIGRKVTTAGSPATVLDERFLYDGWNPVAKFTANGASLTLTAKYVWGLDLSGSFQGAGGVGGLLSVTSTGPGAATYLPSYDANGNIIGWTTDSGTLVRRQDYDPFGNTILKETFVATAGLDELLNHGFSTKPEERETGLLYYGYRFYDPVTGRWPSRDPIEEEGGMNLYGFLENNGTNYVDVLGLYITWYPNSPYIHDSNYPYSDAPLDYQVRKNALAQLVNAKTGDFGGVIAKSANWIDFIEGLQDISLKIKIRHLPIIRHPKAEATYSRLSKTAGLPVDADHKAVVHEMVHAAVHLRKIRVSDRLEEGMAYASEEVGDFIRRAQDFYNTLSNAKQDGEDYKELVRRTWKRNWAMNQRESWVDVEWWWGKEPLENSDIERLRDNFGVDFRCHKIAEIFNALPKSQRHCIFVNCEDLDLKFFGLEFVSPGVKIESSIR